MEDNSEIEEMAKTHHTPNPFVGRLDLPWYRVIQLVAWALAKVALIGVKEEELLAEPITGWRKSCRDWAHWLGRAEIFCGGFMHIRYKGTQVSAAEAPGLVVAPHTSLLDGVLVFVLNEAPSVVAKHEVINMPIMGVMALISQPVFIYRDDKASKHRAIAEIKRRAHSEGKWPQYLIFPEGTTTNGKALVAFKPGAFIPGMPVQPIVLRFTDKWDTTSWTWVSTPPGPLLWWMSMCKLNIGLEVEFLPVYQPSEEEIEDPCLFASNVQKVMADALGVPCSDYTFDDARRMLKEHKAAKKHGVKVSPESEVPQSAANDSAPKQE